MQMVRCVYLAKKSQGKWNKTTDIDNNKIQSLDEELKILDQLTT
jgi:hypothetical protein